MGLALKLNSKWYKTYYLSYLYSCSVTYYISKKLDILEYTTFDKAIQKVIQIDLRAIMVKCDLKDTFWHIPISAQD